MANASDVLSAVLYNLVFKGSQDADIIRIYENLNGPKIMFFALPHDFMEYSSAISWKT